jgi:NAD-dependent deacetylase
MTIKTNYIHMKNLVVLSGAGMSAESGISTFRDSGGLWEKYDVMKVASIDGWYDDRELVLRFYNERRKQLKDAQPNKGHIILADLEKYYNVFIVTQNVDNLHEKAGSTNVLHLHGELTKACSSNGKGYVEDIGYGEISMGDKAKDGSQLRPFIVWFGEAVPLIEEAARIVSAADVLIIVGTSLQVYPAAGLVGYAKPNVPVYLIDPKEVDGGRNVNVIKEKATVGLEILRNQLVLNA